MSNSAATTAGVSITEGLVTALAGTWRAIQHHHPEVPDVVLTLGSGTIGARRGSGPYRSCVTASIFVFDH